jgi:uncharacterized membrane protein (UPF0136 family)
MSLVNLAILYLLILGPLTMVGGYIGFFKKKGWPARATSLLTGGFVGALLVVASLMATQTGGSPTFGLLVGLLACLVIAVRCVVRFVEPEAAG